MISKKKFEEMEDYIWQLTKKLEYLHSRIDELDVLVKSNVATAPCIVPDYKDGWRFQNDITCDTSKRD